MIARLNVFTSEYDQLLFKEFDCLVKSTTSKFWSL